MRVHGVATLLAAGVWLTLPGGVSAAVYKCVAPNGAVTYGDAPCVKYAEPKAPVAADAPVVDAALPEAAAEPVVDEPAQAPEPTTAAAAAPNADEAPTRPLKRRNKFSGNWVIVGFGALLMTAAWVLHFMVAFRAGQTGWGIALVLLSPLSSLAYAIFHFRKALPGWIVGIVGTVVAIGAYVPAADLIDVKDSYLTTRGSYDTRDRRPRTTFSTSDTVHLKTELDWDDWSVETVHFIGWIWYTGDVPVGNYMAPILVKDKPYVLLGHMPAASLGAGDHRVELYFNGQLFDRREFRVVP